MCKTSKPRTNAVNLSNIKGEVVNRDLNDQALANVTIC